MLNTMLGVLRRIAMALRQEMVEVLELQGDAGLWAALLGSALLDAAVQVGTFLHKAGAM